MKKVWIGLLLLTLSAPAFALPAVIIGVAVGAGAFAVGATVFTAIAIGMAAASYYLAKNVDLPSASKSQAELKQMLRSSRPPKQVVYGDTLISGALIFAEEQVDDTENDDGTYDEFLYIAVGVAGHQIEAVHSIYLNETDIIEFGTNAEYQVHNNDTVVDPYLLANAPSWKDDMIGKGTTWLRLGLRFDRELFANGVPTPKLKLSGHNQIWDPRDNSYGYSNNAALVILDFMLKYHRRMTPERAIVSGFGSFIDAANLCDENVTNPDGSTSKRYTINGAFTLDEKPSEVLDSLLAACGGQLVRMNGNIGLLPAAYYGPATFEITDSELIDTVQIQPEVAYGDSINTIKGTFIDPDQFYTEVDYPTITDQDALQRDGGELSADMKFKFVTDVYQAQRLADIELKRSLTGGEVSLKTNLTGLYARLGRVISVNSQAIGLVGEYRVISAEADIKGGIQLSLMRDDISIYDDAIGDEYTPPPLVNLPVGGVTPPSGVQFVVEGIGETVQGFVRWQNNAPQVASTDVRIKNDNGDIILEDNVNGNRYKVSGLVVDGYVAEVRTVTARGQVSTWQSASFSVGIPPAPSSVDVDRSNWNIILKPNIASGVPSGTLFEFRYLADNASYISDPPTYSDSDFPLSTSLFVGSSFNHGGLFPDRWNHYWVRSVSVYGSSSWVYVQTGTTREQDLVTTVVERLVAIEIESQNWDDAAGTGYKLFSPASDPYTLPDGTVLDNPDGLAVFENMVLRGQAQIGDIAGGEGLIIEGDGEIRSADYQAGVRGYKLKKDGSVEFGDGTFRGTVYADKMVGNVVNPVVSSLPPIPPAQAITVYSVFLPAESYARYFVFGSPNILVINASARYYLNNQLLKTVSPMYGGLTGAYISIPQHRVVIPANTAATLRLDVQSDAGAGYDVGADFPQDVIHTVYKV